MSTFNEKKFLDRIQKLSQLNKMQEAIKLLLPIIKNEQLKDNPRLFLRYAFLLYHIRLQDYSSKRGSKKYIVAKNNMIKAKKILLKIISLRNGIVEKKDLLNAKIALAQIYAITKNKKAVPLAISNYENSPSTVTANRLANVYLILGNVNKAKIWYKKYENLLIKNKLMDFVALGDLAVIYKSLGDQAKANKYFKKAVPLIPKNSVGWCMSCILYRNGFPIKKQGF
jgi:tetratricopeptide (TPR) repeat protein